MTDKKKWLLQILCVFIPAVLFVMFIYTDIMETTRDGITFWNALFFGKIREFYVMNSDVVISNQFGISNCAIYDIPVYILIAIWNLPLWIYEKITGLYALDSMLGVLWAKAVALPYLVGIQYCITKIGRELKGDTYPVRLSIMMTLSSVFILTPILIMGQYDAMSLFFMMLGVLAYIKGENKKFVFWFAIALPFKMFALFVFIPLVLLKEKRIRYILLQGIEGCSFLLLCKIVQKVFFIPDTNTANYLSGHLLTFIFQSQINFVYESSSIFIFAFVLVCLFCYLKKTPEQEEIGRWALYVSLLGLAVFFMTSLTHPQWSLLLFPFVELLICCSEEKHMRVGLLLETVFSFGLLLAQIIYYYWVFNVKTSVFTLAGKLFYNGKRSVDFSIREVLAGHSAGLDVGYLNIIGGGVFVAGLLFFLYWSKPDTRRDQFAEMELSCEGMIALRLLAMAMVGAALIVILL